MAGNYQIFKSSLLQFVGSVSLLETLCSLYHIRLAVVSTSVGKSRLHETSKRLQCLPQEVCEIVCFTGCVKIVLKYAPHWGEVLPRAVPGNAMSSVQVHIEAQGVPQAQNFSGRTR